MNKFITTLNKLDINKIQEEVAGKKVKNSNTINETLKITYPNIKSNTSSKSNLLKVWKNIITQTANPREGTISRIWLKLYRALDRIIKGLYDNENTSEGVFTEFRKVIKDKYGVDSEIYKQSVYNLGVSQERSKERKEEYAAKVKARNAARGELQPIYVEDILDIIHKLKVSNDPYEKALAVLLATGSRSVEIFKVSKYYEVKEDPTSITVVGVAKDKGGRGYDNITVQRPLVGLTGREVVELVADIRGELDLKGNNKKITSLTNRALNKSFKKHIQPLAPDFPISSHKTRYIYGNVAYMLFGKPKNIPYESFLSEILTHASSESTKSYLGINIKFKNKIIEKSSNDIKDLFQNEIKQLKEKVDRNCPDISNQIDLSPFKNSRRRGMTKEEKIENVIGALDLLQKNKIKITQRELRQQLGYAAAIMTEAYKLYASS